jgi:hypothetical protein
VGGGRIFFFFAGTEAKIANLLPSLSLLDRMRMSGATRVYFFIISSVFRNHYHNNPPKGKRTTLSNGRPSGVSFNG